jgi:hypothetical protein
MPTQWVAYAVENIITHQRVASISYDFPRFPFLSKLLGQKESTHIVFGSDDESENEDRGQSCITADIQSNSDEATQRNVPNSDNDSSDHSDDDDISTSFQAPRVDVSNLDSSQRLALTNTLASIDRGWSLELVQGPPGCGKTFFLVHLLLTLVHEKKKRVLVSAPSNKAISVIVEQYSKRRFTKWKDDLIVSIGVEDKFDKCRDHHHDRDILAGPSQLETCERHLLELWAASDCRGMEHSSSTTVAHLQSLPTRTTKSTMPTALLTEAVVSALECVTNPSNVLDVLVYKYASKVAAAVNYLGISFAACTKYHVTSILDNDSCQQCVTSVVKVVLNTLAREYADMIDTLQAVVGQFFNATVEIVDKKRIFKTSADKIHANIYKALEHLSWVYDSVWSCVDKSQCADMSGTVEDATAEVVHQLRLLHTLFDSSENSDYVADELLSNARVVCSTLSTAGCGLMKKQSDTFDVLLVDEAGQCLEGELLIPCFLNPSSLVLIGDPQQLPATVLSMEVQEKRLGTSSMQRLMASSQEKKTGYQLLATQYRMHPSICSFPNDQFYQGRLNTACSIRDRPSIISGNWLERYPILFVNVSGAENTGTMYSKSRYNVAEAEMTAQ